MTTVPSKKGQIVLPSAMRERLHFEPGQNLKVLFDDADTILLRRISRRPYESLIDHLLACPYPFENPPRAKDPTRPISL